MEAAPGKKILIIEDERDVVDLLTFNLRKAGFTASTATDGGAGLQRARSEKPAFIILDLMLPKMPVSRAAQPRNDHQFLTWDIPGGGSSDCAGAHH